MPKADFTHVGTWVFDLDNTLYPPRIRLFDQIEARMTRYVMATLGVDRAEADHLRTRYWAEYGTTLAGLMEVHGIDPDPYLVAVHDIDFDVLPSDPDLAARLADLPGRRVFCACSASILAPGGVSVTPCGNNHPSRFQYRRAHVGGRS